MASALNNPISSLKGVGPKVAQKLADLGINTVEDVLFHFPLRYQDKTKVTPIAGLADGVDAVIYGTVEAAGVVPGKRRSLVVKVADGTGLITVRFFHFRHNQVDQFRPGVEVTLFGQPRRGNQGADMVHPEYRIGGPETQLENALTPIYPTVEGIGQAIWRRLSDQALAMLRSDPPMDLLQGFDPGKFGLVDALTFLHRPPPGASLGDIRDGVHPAQLRLAREELIAHHLSMRDIRMLEQQHSAPMINPGPEPGQKLLATLPFKPTDAQTRVAAEILEDLAKPHPMLRLVQGDVGSGKTLVAALAAVQAIAAGYQVALMAPTELLAEQHLRNFSVWFEALEIPIAWLSGRIKGKARLQALEQIETGAAPMVIGTHALFQEQVKFANLGLVMVDEQHRFGVHQRLSLTEKGGAGGHPHQLVLTATPIPRTLSMVAYADLDCSIIDELPPGRKPVKTTVLENSRRDDVIDRVGKACQEGRQAYWVCTIIDESEVLEAQAAEATAAFLAEQLPKNVRVGLIHGRLNAQDKESVMSAFKDGKLDVLVATTVIEVGVDVPNASLMIIENPERLGLAQLHQLRGRVGRGAQESFCLLLYQSPLSQNGRARLDVMRESNDGFYIAEEDLRLRGPGELLGTRQTGLMSFRVAQLPEHEHLLDEVQQIAERIAEDRARTEALMDRWTGERRAFARV